VRHVVIGTAGHVDHGKTSLVHALTGVMTDRLPEEQRRGITIELGFAPWRINDDLLVSVIDAPGHRKLVHHMIAGASGIDIVLLVVAADEGVMPQTREHVAACKLLGVVRAVVAITKVDRVERDLAELAAEEAKGMLEEQGIVAEAVLCSGKTGEGIDEVRRAMIAAIEEAGLGNDRRGRVRLSVDRVFTVKGSGTVVTGTLVEGELREGAALRILGPERDTPTTARGLHVHGEMRPIAAAPTRLAINLGGVSTDEVSRGDVITDDAHATPTRVLDVWLQALEPMKRGSEASIFIGTAHSTAKVQPVDKTDVLDEGGMARLRLTAPLVVLGGDRFVLRGARLDGPAGAVIGGGVVLDTRPPRNMRAAKRAELLRALHEDDAPSALVALVRERSPRALRKTSLSSRFAIDGDTLRSAAKDAVKDRTLIKVREDGWVAADAITTLSTRAIELVTEHHKAAPLDPGLKLQTLREQLATLAGVDVTEEVIARMTAGKTPALVVAGDSARLPTFAGAADDPRAQRALDGAKRTLGDAALNGMTENAMAETLDVDQKTVRALLAKLVRDEDAIKTTGGLWFHKPSVDQLERQIVAHLNDKGRLTIAELKEMTGLGRKQSIPLLEHFDRIKVTKRDGSDRVKGS
jgi:selenocysteine-specific elongation factor